MPLDLYYLTGSPPCRAVLLTAKLVGVELNLKKIDLETGEHLKPEYLKINPTHTVPTLVDGDTIIVESRAMMTYLVNQYAKNDSLYPKDPKKRVLVDQRLYFDIGTLYTRFADYYYTPFFTNTPYDPAKLEKLKEAIQFLDKFLENSEFVSGNFISLADLTIYVSITTAESCRFDLTPYKNISRWLKAVKGKMPKSDEDQKHYEAFKQWYSKALDK